MTVKYEQKLEEVNFEQAKKLKTIGFDWQCDKAFDEQGKEVNWTTKQFFCWKPTIALAYMFFRKRYGIIPSFHGRHLEDNFIAYSICYILHANDCPYADLSQYLSDGHEDEDGVVKIVATEDYSYEAAEIIALDTMINYIYPNFEQDYSWLQPGISVAFKDKVKGTPSYSEFIIIEVDENKKMIKIDDDLKDPFWQYFHNFKKV